MTKREGETKEERRLRRQQKKEKKEKKKEKKRKREESSTPNGRQIKEEQSTSSPTETAACATNDDSSNKSRTTANPGAAKTQTTQNHVSSQHPKDTVTPSSSTADGNTSIREAQNGKGNSSSTTQLIKPIQPRSQAEITQRNENHSQEEEKVGPFQRKTVSLLVSLLPSALADMDKAIHRSMKSLLTKHSDSFGGILLAYENVRMEDDNGVIRESGEGCGMIINEYPHIHFRFRADVLVFSPDNGMRLTGVVNETFPSHIGVLVCSLFNAMVSADNLREKGYFFDRDLNEWNMGRSAGSDDNGGAIAIGESLEFSVEKLHECNGIISLEGSDPKLVDA